MRKFFTVSALILLAILIADLRVTPIHISDMMHGTVHRMTPRDTQILPQLAYQKAYLAGRELARPFQALTFVGDVLLARNVEVLMDRHGPNYPFQGLSLGGLQDKSAVVGNLETSIPEKHIPTAAYSLDFSMHESSIELLADNSYTHVSVANNHSDDFGVRGLANTVSLLSDSSLQVFGEVRAFDYDSISVVPTSFGQIALIGLDDTIKRLTAAEMQSVMSRAERISDFQIAYIHWGVEYVDDASSRQEYIAEYLIQKGADFIVGHHPHVVQNVDVIDGVPVFYSLGNYIFDQYFSAEVQTGLVVTLSLKPEPAIRLTPVQSMTQLSQPQPITGDAKASFLYELSEKSHPEIASSIRRGVIPMEKVFATSPKIAMISK